MGVEEVESFFPLAKNEAIAQSSSFPLSLSLSLCSFSITAISSQELT